MEDDIIDCSLYQKLVEKLIYLSHTRPDIANSIVVVSQFMHSPHESHMKVTYKILRHLKSTPSKEILFQKNGNIKFEAYDDAN